MEPDLATPPELAAELAELEILEYAIHHPKRGTPRAEIERLFSEDFWETGASGKRYSRAFVLDVLEGRTKGQNVEVWEASGFQCRLLCPGVVLLTYDLVQNAGRITRRASVWRKTLGGWKVLYHQGTVALPS